ncbi:ABC transporter permease [Streptomyces sp. NPDC050145]|uniref:ABC transporter permease n=1 Tax=Streptomyces sp. NPDC050145 TaxID=3365602 RepID=UPI003794817A
MAEILAEQPGLKQRLPGRQAGVIDRGGVADPDELFAYIGVRHAHLPDGYRIDSFGKPYVGTPTIEEGALDIVRFTMVGVVLLPLGVFLAVCARLSAASRARRLAALRLVGLSAKGTQRVNAAETVVSALLAGLCGLGLYLVLNQVGARAGLPGLKWYPEDGAPSAVTLVACLVGCPLLAWFVSRAGTRDAVGSPLSVRRSAAARRPTRWGFLPLLAGTGIAAGYCVAGATGHAPRTTGLSAILIPASVVLIGAGLALSLPVLAQFLARRVAASTRSFALGLAMRRNEVEAGSALRVATGLVLVVFAASLTQGVLIELDQVYRNDSPEQEYSIQAEQLSDAQIRGMGRIAQVRAQVTATASWRDLQSERNEPSVDILIATCDQLAAMTERLGGCVDGRTQLLRSSQGVADPQAKPGAVFPVRLRRDGRPHMWKLTVPESVVRVSSYGLSAADDASVLVPPSALPPGSRPEGASIILASRSDTDTVRTVLDGIGAVAPVAQVDPVGINIDGIRQVALIKSLLGVGMVLGLIIGVAAYLVAAGDRAVERRVQVTALTLLGTRRRTLRAVQVAQVVMPLGVGLVLALVTGKLVESSYLVSGGGEVFWDGDGVPLLIGSALGVVGIAALGSLPLIGRRIDPELIRRD